MKKHATALRAFTHADEPIAKGQTILNMDGGQFADWSADGVDLVREATEAEVAKARGEKPSPAAKAAKPKAQKPKLVKPKTALAEPAAPAQPVPAETQVDPA